MVKETPTSSPPVNYFLSDPISQLGYYVKNMQKANYLPQEYMCAWILSELCEDGDNIPSITTHHEEPGDAFNKEVNILQVAERGMTWCRWW
jgi:hypothetical protein